MSSIVGGKAIAAHQRGDVEERPYARTFAVRGTGGQTYDVTLSTYDHGRTGPQRDVCTCKAGQNGQRCYHLGAAKLSAGKTPPPVGELVRLLAALRGRTLTEGMAPPEDAEARADALLDGLGVTTRAAA